MNNVVIPKTVNPDLVKERKNCNFNIEEFAQWWAGDEDQLIERRKRGKELYMI